MWPFELGLFTQHNVLEIYPGCWVYQYFVPFYCWMVLHWMCVSCLLLVDIWVVSSLGLLPIKLQWKLGDTKKKPISRHFLLLHPAYTAPSPYHPAECPPTWECQYTFLKSGFYTFLSCAARKGRWPRWQVKHALCHLNSAVWLTTSIIFPIWNFVLGLLAWKPWKPTNSTLNADASARTDEWETMKVLVKCPKKL